MTRGTTPARRASSAPTQVARLLAMLPSLRSHPYAPVSEVAALFGVSERQVVRDLHVLWVAGLPGLEMGDYIEVDMEAVEGEGVIGEQPRIVRSVVPAATVTFSRSFSRVSC